MKRQYNRNTKRRPSAALAGVVAAAVAAIVLATACSSVDCPLNNRVYTKYSLRTPGGTVDTLKMTCTVSTNRADGSDSVIINRDTLVTEMSLPMSYTHPQDTFFVDLSSETFSSLDTIVVSKEDYMHFESTECAASYFHKITGVTTTHHAIDSVAVKTSGVTYDTSKNHFYIYFTPRD